MKKNNRTIITTIITASLLLISTGCSQSVEVVNVTPDITTDSTAVTTINTEAEKPKTTTAATTAAQTTAQTTTQTTTAAETTVITTVPVTEAPPVTKQTEAPAPVITTTTTTTKAAPVVTTTTTTITTTTTAAPAPKQEEKTDEDRSYLNLTPSEVQGILDECTKYAKSLGYRCLTYAEYKIEEDEYDRKQREIQDNDGSQEELDKVREAWKADLKYISNYDCEQFWSTGWHNIAFAGDYDLVKGGDMDGYWLCKTKQESIDWLKGYLKFYIKLDYDEGRSSGAIATPLKTFDQMAKEDKCIFPYDVLHSYYADYMVYDINTSYAFCVKFG